MNIKLDTAIIYNDEEIIDIIHGRTQGLFRSIRDHTTWETIMEDLDESGITVKNLDELEEAYASGKLESFTYNIKIFRGKTYKY